jgi:hypothetical protein
MTKQEIISERATKKILNFLNAVHMAKGIDNIIYANQLTKLTKFHRIAIAMPTFMVKKGYAVKVSYGVYKIIQSPTFNFAEILKMCQNESTSAAVLKHKKNEPKTVLKVTKPCMFASNITKAISLLKQAGYKVLKPITQYEEV